MGSELDLSLIANPYHQMELAYLSTSMGDVGARASKRMIENIFGSKHFKHSAKSSLFFLVFSLFHPIPKIVAKKKSG